MPHSIELRKLSLNCKHTISSINFAFGSRVRQVRLSRRMCAVDLAGCLGITRSHLEDIESGVAPVDLTMVVLLSSAMSLGVADLLQGL